MTMADNKGKWVHVVTEDGEPVPAIGDNTVPAHWLGTDLLPAGTKAKGKAATPDPDADSSGGVPAKSSTREELDAYATGTAGMTEDEVKSFGTKDELHAELVKRSQDNTQS